MIKRLMLVFYCMVSEGYNIHGNFKAPKSIVNGAYQLVHAKGYMYNAMQI